MYKIFLAIIALLLIVRTRLSTVIKVILCALLGAIVLYQRGDKRSVPVRTHEDIIIVGTNAEYPPFAFIKQGQIVGFDIDVITQVAQRLGKAISIKDMPFDSLMIEAIKGHIDVIAAGMTPTAERKKQMYFTTPYYSGDPLMIVTLASKEPVQDLTQLTGKDVAVNEGFTADLYLSSCNQDLSIIRLATSADALIALQTGRVDAYVTALNSLKPIVEKVGKDQFHLAPLADAQDSYALIVSRNYPALYLEVEEAVKDMLSDGTIDQLKAKWGLS